MIFGKNDTGWINSPWSKSRSERKRDPLYHSFSFSFSPTRSPNFSLSSERKRNLETIFPVLRRQRDISKTYHEDRKKQKFCLSRSTEKKVEYYSNSKISLPESLETSFWIYVNSKTNLSGVLSCAKPNLKKTSLPEARNISYSLIGIIKKLLKCHQNNLRKKHFCKNVINSGEESGLNLLMPSKQVERV